MTLNQQQDNLLMKVVEVLSSTPGDGMKQLLEAVLNAVMKAERNKALGSYAL